MPIGRDVGRVARRPLSVAAIFAALALLGVTLHAGEAVRLPIFHLPHPSGTFGVGTSTATLARDLTVQVWYPARLGAAGPIAPYRAEARGGTFRDRLMRRLVATDATVDAPVAPGRFALLAYVPGWGQTRADNTATVQDLASHGFVVVGVDDTYARPDMDFTTQQSYAHTVRWANTKVVLAAAKLSAVVSALQHGIRSEPLRSVVAHTDFERIGAFGYSFGGATAAEAAVRDGRFRAAADLDGWTFGAMLRSGLRKPFLFIGSGAATTDALTLPAPLPLSAGTSYYAAFDQSNGDRMFRNLKRVGGYALEIDGTQHESFCDIALLPHVEHAARGTMDRFQVERIVVALLVGFFDSELNGRPAPPRAPFASLAAGTIAGQRGMHFHAWPAARAESSASHPTRMTSVIDPARRARAFQLGLAAGRRTFALSDEEGPR